ncbi:MAG: hypothetical protein V1709_01095 [Planctomycetota bacterium]
MINQDPNMKLINSKRNTFFNKKVFPVFWFGMIALFMFMAFPTVKGDAIIPFFMAPIMMTVVGGLIMKLLIFDLVDEVWDRGDVLIIRNKKEEDIIPLANIMNISYTTFVNPPRVTLMLRQSCKFGKEVTFMPPLRWFNFTRSPIVDELIERVDRARK